MANKNGSSLMSTHYEKVQLFTPGRSKLVSADYSRSRNPYYDSVSKYQDVTRFNSYNNRVAFYNNYPNRSGTPIKIQSERQKPGFRKSLSPRYTQVKELFKDSPKNSQLLKQAMQADLKLGPIMPTVTAHKSGIVHFVMNDFHIKETNPGFARNDMGGFYTK